MERWQQAQEMNHDAIMATREMDEELAAIGCEYHMEED